MDTPRVILKPSRGFSLITQVELFPKASYAVPSTFEYRNGLVVSVFLRVDTSVAVEYVHYHGLVSLVWLASCLSVDSVFDIRDLEDAGFTSVETCGAYFAVHIPEEGGAALPQVCIQVYQKYWSSYCTRVFQDMLVGACLVHGKSVVWK